ncbi:MAG: 3-oxo-tetronate kinase [Hyphomicrobiales bacterium]
MRTVLGCIADDFTGATDLAGLLARSGVRVSLRIGVPSAPPKDGAALEVIALKCRTSPVDDAVAEVMAAYEWLNAAGAQNFFWKYCSTFDSTDEGNIGPVAEALMDAIGTDQTIYCPAFPENGRTTYMGVHFVGRQPLAESPMKDHPLTPMRESDLTRLLAPQVKRTVGLVEHACVAKGSEQIERKLAQLHDQGVAHVIIDAIAGEDLIPIAKATRNMPLITGGSAVAAPLPDLYLKEGLIAADAMRPPSPSLARKSVILSGSCSAMTNAQVAHYQTTGAPSYQLDPIELMTSGRDGVLAWLSKQDLGKAPLIYATASPTSVHEVQEKLGVEVAGKLIEDTLAACAIVARDLGVRRIVVAGGETSGAVTKALEISQLDIAEEIAPGVPWTFCQSKGEIVALTLKSGNFGNENFFADALNKLDT